MSTFGVSKSGIYYCGNKFIKAALSKYEDIDINMPSTKDEWEDVRHQFEAKTTTQIMRGCVGVIDGCFAPLICSTLKESEGTPRPYYYSGHYQCFGLLNVQAVCTASLCFLSLM
jgi:hypothetical protein